MKIPVRKTKFHEQEHSCDKNKIPVAEIKFPWQNGIRTESHQMNIPLSGTKFLAMIQTSLYITETPATDTKHYSLSSWFCHNLK